MGSLRRSSRWHLRYDGDYFRWRRVATNKTSDPVHFAAEDSLVQGARQGRIPEQTVVCPNLLI
jgi:hypothetical protein